MYPLKTKVKYNPDNLAASCNTFTTVYLGNYVSGNYEEGAGSHPGVDIFPIMPHDSVFACLDGVVEIAENKAANGNYIIIRHDNVPDPADMTKKTTLHSCYLHLTEYNVAAGQLVSEGDEIGKCGNTGNVSGSTGEHLHFQIDRKEAPFHPYWPFSFAEAKTEGLGFFEAVNKGLGIDNARKYTVDPLVYLDQVEVYDGTNPHQTSPINKSPAVSSVLVASIGNPPVQRTEWFIDVPVKHPYAIAINFLKAKKIVGGNNGKFSPDATITRAELLKMVFVAAGITLVTGGPNYFSDIDPDSWQSSYANTAKTNKVIGGYPDGTFKPNNPITRSEAFKVIINTFHQDTLDTVSFPVFDDVPSDVWYAPYANFAKVNELIDFPSSRFEPSKSMNRGEAASAIYALMKR